MMDVLSDDEVRDELRSAGFNEWATNGMMLAENRIPIPRAQVGLFRACLINILTDKPQWRKDAMN